MFKSTTFTHANTTDVTTTGIDRYVVKLTGMFWSVFTGTGTRPRFTSFFKHRCENIRDELVTAFEDGKWVGECTSGSLVDADIVERLEKRITDLQNIRTADHAVLALMIENSGNAKRAIASLIAGDAVSAIIPALEQLGFEVRHRDPLVDGWMTAGTDVIDPKFVIGQLLDALPKNRDWLDPQIEKMARAVVQK